MTDVKNTPVVSAIDPSRNTVGQIYTDAQKNKAPVIVGDMTSELMKSLVEDLNDTMESNPFDGNPFYITVYEKKDLQMPRAILRRLYVSKYRPYPEDDTVVFKTNPSNGETHFCWCLPHWSEMDNILMNILLYDSELVRTIKDWKNMNLENFGFVKNEDGSNWTANPKWKDDLLD